MIYFFFFFNDFANFISSFYFHSEFIQLRNSKDSCTWKINGKLNEYGYFLFKTDVVLKKKVINIKDK